MKEEREEKALLERNQAVVKINFNISIELHKNGELKRNNQKI